jgi:GTP-binding protein
MRIKSSVFHTSARDLASAPAWDRPEFAFIGRSNVGKSSMVNMLANSKGLAKVSATPGKTRLLNFFVMNGEWSLVDLPGYGYAKVAKSEKVDFLEAAGDYLERRPNLRRVFVLIDSRLPPQRIDLDFTAWLGGRGVPFSLIFTKADKQSAAKTRSAVAAFLAAMADPAAGPLETILSSSKDGTGRGEILHAIGAALE